MSLEEAKNVERMLPVGVTAEEMRAVARGCRKILILKTAWYPEILDGLEQSARAFFLEWGVPAEALVVHSVPGSFELPLGVKMFLDGASWDCVVALGCVVRGGTPHFEYVCQASVQGLQTVQLESGVPVGMGVLTVDSLEQALARKNKGAEAAQAALWMRALRELGRR